MSFSFTVWEDTKWFGDPEGISKIFSTCIGSLAEHRVWLETIRDQEIDFKVIDVRQRKASSSSSSDLAEKFIGALGELLVSQDLPEGMQKHTRLLFVGSTGLAKWESEKSGDLRSIKKDIEFVIRTLQSYRLAHYVYVEGLPDSQNAVGPKRNIDGQTISKELVVSALLSFARRHAHDVSADASATLQELRSDITQSLNTIHELQEFKTLGQLEGAGDSNKVRMDLLLNEVRLLFQFGKRNRDSPWSPRELIGKSGINSTTFQMKLPDSSYDLGTLLSTQIAAWARDARLVGGRYESKDSKSAQKLAAILYKIRRYEILRDLGRVLGSAAIPTLREKRPSKNILIIDDWDYQKRAELEPLGKVLKLVGWDDYCFLTESRFIRCDGDPLDSDQYARLFDQGVPFRRLSDGAVSDDAPRRPEEYDVIIIDPEAVSDQYGPERLERLANYLKEVSRDKEDDRRKIAKGLIKDVPRIIAYSQRESSSNVQQCLNLGAWAFVTKGRCFRLLFEISRSVKIMKKRHRNDTSQASHFRILNSLKPSAVSELQRADGTTYVYGGMYPNFQSYGTSHSAIDDSREYDWIRELPKADLHCHIGTAIAFPTIRLLALNTVGYLLDAKKGIPKREEERHTSKDGKAFPAGAEDLISRVTRTVVLAETLLASISPRPSNLSPMIALAAAAAGVTGSLKLKYAAFGLGDIVIAALLKPNDRAQDFQVAALLVSAIELFGSSVSKHFVVVGEVVPTEVAEYLSYIAKRWEGSTPVHRRILLENRIGFHAESAWRLATEKARVQLSHAAGRWDGYYTSETIRTSFDDREPKSDRFWKKLEVSFKERTGAATTMVEAGLNDGRRWLKEQESAKTAWSKALDWLRNVDLEPAKLNADREKGAESLEKGDSHSFGLEKYVCIDQMLRQDGTQTGLQLYLRGADLLGSAHLQYPDNLLLASYSIARDNAQENIIYSEVRCETTGYTKGGMGAQDATEILLHGFTMASLFLATEYKSPAHVEAAQTWPLVRVNLLLAAKRHKSESEARKVIALLDGYLERRPGDADQSASRREYPDVFPSWWRPSDVVGFDISGDESKTEAWLEEVLKPLAERSSPITIHAGEAASAENIWHAVYALNATRIGHGLRLAEDVALLGYCVREGICMEMCPNSNQFTNAFRYISPNSTKTLLRQHSYPVLDYMSRGLEVTIATDNRYLHPSGRRTLTSEYITAARLVGGMTQWEVLQIVKAGFKNAFLDKYEVSELILAVEEKIYGIIAAAP